MRGAGTVRRHAARVEGAMASCLELGSGWCGHGACVNASAAGHGAAGCVCDSDWALERRLVNPEVSTPRCTISLLRFRVLNAELMAVMLLLAALTARSMLAGSLGRRRGCVVMLGHSIVIALAAEALARGPQASASGVAWRLGLFFLSLYCISVNFFIALDKYVKTVKGSASGQERSERSERSLERETVGALVGLAALWAVLVTTLVAINWPSDAAFFAPNLVYGMIVNSTIARHAHVILKKLDSDLAFVAEHVSNRDVIDKIRRLRRKASLIRSLTVRLCLCIVLFFFFGLLIDLSGLPVWQFRDEFICVVYTGMLVAQIKKAAFERRRVHALPVPSRVMQASTKLLLEAKE